MTDKPEDDLVPETPRACGACGGVGGTSSEPCKWCTHGYQDHRQHIAWQRFRARTRNLSGSYDVLEETMHEVLRKLGDRHDEAASGFGNEGTRLLEEWGNAQEAPIEDRRSINDRIASWIKRSIDYLAGKP